MGIHNLFKTGILALPALCGAWGFAAQPVEIINNSRNVCWISADAPMAGLALEIVAGGTASPATDLEDLPLDPGEKLVLTPPAGDGPAELGCSLKFILGPGQMESWSAQIRFGETSSIPGLTAGTAQPEIACKAAGNLLTLQMEAAAGEGLSRSPRPAAKRAAAGPAAGSAAGESKAAGAGSPAGAGAGAGAAAAGAAAVEAKGSPAKAKPLALVPHTFTDVIPSNYMAPAIQAKVSLPFPYRTADPAKTRLFFQGEVLFIDPETTGFAAFVTYPLRPCIFGCIRDPQTGRMLVFHKNPVQNMKSLAAHFAKLAAASPDQLTATLFSCELSEALKATFKPYYGKKTQIQDMKEVRDHLVNQFKIPADRIELRYLTDTLNKRYPWLGQYEQTQVTAGVTRSGEVFNTSVLSGDFFGLGSLPLTPAMTREMGGAKTFSQLPTPIRFGLASDVSERIHSLVKARYDTDLSRNTYWSRDFYSAADRLDVPAATLGARFGIKLQGDSFTSVKAVPEPPVEAKSAAAAGTETKAVPGQAGAERKKKKKGKGKPALAEGKAS